MKVAAGARGPPRAIRSSSSARKLCSSTAAARSRRRGRSSVSSPASSKVASRSTSTGCARLRPARTWISGSGADLHPLVGKRLLFIDTQYAKRGRDVVLSRRPLPEAEAKAAREIALKTLPIGTFVEGTVRSVVGFGAFLDVGGVEGLVPLAEMSHNRGDGPHDVFKVGDKTPVKILKIDDRGKVWLSRRAAIPDPWLEVAKKYALGTKLTGKIVRLQPFGAFVELEPGIDGLIHAADLSLKRIEHPSEVVKEGTRSSTSSSFTSKWETTRSASTLLHWATRGQRDSPARHSEQAGEGGGRRLRSDGASRPDSRRDGSARSRLHQRRRDGHPARDRPSPRVPDGEAHADAKVCGGDRIHGRESSSSR